MLLASIVTAWICNLPGPKSGTWGTHGRGEFAGGLLRFMLSHPFARKKAKGWGTGYCGVNPLSGTSNVRAIPGLKIQTWGTHIFVFMFHN
jgi:hypothetical protein